MTTDGAVRKPASLGVHPIQSLTQIHDIHRIHPDSPDTLATPSDIVEQHQAAN
jgi:hypothetical protein